MIIHYSDMSIYIYHIIYMCVCPVYICVYIYNRKLQEYEQHQQEKTNCAEQRPPVTNLRDLLQQDLLH